MLINPLRQLKKKTMKKMGISSGKSFRKMEKKRRREMAKKILAEKGV